MKSWIAAGAIAIALAAPAFADQCAWLDKDQTAKLQKLIDSKFDGAAGLVTFCGTCGDKEAEGWQLTDDAKVVIKKEDDTYSSFSYQKSGHTEQLDAAYTYLPAEKDPPFKAAKSLAVEIGCPVDADTPKTIDVDADGKVTVPK